MVRLLRWRTQKTFDPVAHRVVRLRESGGTITWSTAPDGGVFTEWFQLATPSGADDAAVGIMGGTYAPIANPGGATFDKFNVP